MGVFVAVDSRDEVELGNSFVEVRAFDTSYLLILTAHDEIVNAVVSRFPGADRA